METQLITSLSNPLVKRARALRQKKVRLESGLFLVEGIHHVGEAVEAEWDVDSVLYAPDLLKSHFAQDLLARLTTPSAASARTSRPVLQPVSADVMDSLAEKENPQGILAAVHQKKSELADLRAFRSGVALVSPQDPGNVGTILRTMDAAAADVLFLLDGGVDLYHPSVVRASMGTLFWKPAVQTSFDEFVKWARGSEPEGIQLIGTSAHADVDFRTLIPRSPWVLVMGNEQKGLTAKQTRACDVAVALPMKGRASSLNLSVAAGVLLYALNM